MKTMSRPLTLSSFPGKKVQETGASGLDGIVKKVGDVMLTDQVDLAQFQTVVDCPIGEADSLIEFLG